MLEQFFATTRTSVYKLSWTGGVLVVMKVALKGESDIPAEALLNGGNAVWIGAKIVMVPSVLSVRASDGTVTILEAKSGSTSFVVALFFTREMAVDCLGSKENVPNDPRWRESTGEVLTAIGEDHPAFWIPREPGERLLID